MNKHEKARKLLDNIDSAYEYTQEEVEWKNNYINEMQQIEKQFERYLELEYDIKEKLIGYLAGRDISAHNLIGELIEIVADNLSEELLDEYSEAYEELAKGDDK